jgi:hypothetical protein
MANWMLIAVLLRVSDAARRPVDASASARPSGATASAPAQLHGAPTEVIKP